MSFLSGRRILTILAAVFVCAMIPPARAEDSTFILALSWQPAFCASDAGRSKAECRDPGDDDWAHTHFTLHGLWPNADRNGDGRVDAEDDYCLLQGSRAQSIARDKADWRQLPAVDLPDDLRQRLNRVMPGTASKLERHQWIKHGTCSGLGAARYFAAAVALTEAMAGTELSKFVAAKAGGNVTRRDLLRAFAAEFGIGSERALQLLCKKDDRAAYLAEIRLPLHDDAIEAPLSAGSLDMGRVTKGNCPARFRVEGALDNQSPKTKPRHLAAAGLSQPVDLSAEGLASYIGLASSAS